MRIKKPLFIITTLLISLFTLTLGKSFLDVKQTSALNDQIIIKLELDPSSQKIEVKNAIALRGGFINNATQIPDSLKEIIAPSVEGDYEFQVKNGLTVSSKTPIQFYEYIFGLPPKSNIQTYNELQKLPKPVAIVQVNYSPTSDFFIKEKKSGKNIEFSKDKINDVKNSPQSISFAEIEDFKAFSPDTVSAATADGYLDILFIASGYGTANMGIFRTDHTALAAYLRTIPPYKDYTAKIRTPRLENTADLGCHFDDRNVLLCDIDKVWAAAAQKNYDTVIVVHKSTQLGGTAYLGWFAMITNSTLWDAKRAMMHEIGHSFGLLWDEYSYGNNGTVPMDIPNCTSDPTCQNKWGGTPRTVCSAPCFYNNAYAPSTTCMMRYPWVENIQYDIVCSRFTAYRISLYTTTSTPGPTSGSGKFFQ